MTLRNARQTAKMSIKELADAVGVSAAAICRYENGERTPRIRIAKNIERILGIPWYDIVDGKAAEGDDHAVPDHR